MITLNVYDNKIVHLRPEIHLRHYKKYANFFICAKTDFSYSISICLPISVILFHTKECCAKFL